MQLTEWQVILLGMVASVIVWVLRLLASKGWQPSKAVVAVFLYIVSLVLSVAFSPVTFPQFPPFNDAPSFVAALLQFIGALLTIGAPVTGFAFLIYNFLLQRVLEAVRVRVKKLFAVG